MPDTDVVELLRLGPFIGIDYTTAEFLVDKGYGRSANNANTARKTGALMTERGRVQMHDFSNILADVQVLYECIAADNQPYVIVQGDDASGDLQTYLYNVTANSVAALSSPGYPTLHFTQAVQYGAVVYTNAGQRFFLDPIEKQAYEWQYPPPMSFHNIGLTPETTGGDMLKGTYYYVVTYQTIMPDGSVSETSVNYNQYANPPNAVITTNTGSMIVTPLNGFLFTGTNPDGTTFTTNLYRQSSNQAGYLLVANLTTNAPYTDTASDISLLQNVELEVSRDPPPVTENNLGWVCLHKSRVWCFVVVDNAATENIAQVQVWYSNLDRPWEFDSTSQVLLCQSDITSAGIDYFGAYGNEPMGMVEVGTILLAITRRQTWGIYGDAPIDFFQRQLFNIGAVAPFSILGVSGGAYWLSDTGLYFFDGSSPSPNAERITAYFRGIPGWPATPALPGISTYDQERACASFYNLTYYLHFPTLQQTLAYHAPSGQWLGVIPYAPRYAQSVYAQPANQSSFAGLTWNEVLVARSGDVAAIDWYFADQNNDLSLPQTCDWDGPTSYGPDEASQKVYRFLTLTGPLCAGSAIVTLTVDPGCTPPKVVTWTVPDLSVLPRPIKTLGYEGGKLWGFAAQISVQLTGVAGQPAPQLWSVVCWGAMPPDRRLVPQSSVPPS
jgi:hypothetical protein